MAYYPDFKHLMTTPQYGFLRTEPRLGRRIMLLGLGGSYAYGTNNENSDIDFRGITLNMPSDLIGLTDFEQYEDSGTDTVIYSFNKMVKLLLECNPNTCEILGLDHDQYLIKSRLGQELLDNRNLFLSKRAAKSFGGYASAQLRRLQNAIARDSMPQTERERHIFNSVKHALEDLMNAVVFALSVSSILIIGEDIPWNQLCLLHLAHFLVQLELAGICFGISSFLRRSGIGIGLGIAAVMYFLNITANLSKSAEFLKYITPFAYAEGADILAAGSLEGKLLLPGILYTLIGICTAYWKYCGKDIQ